MLVHANGLVEHQQPAALPNGPETVAHALEHGVAKYPDRLALVDWERSWTFTELHSAVTEAAQLIDVHQPLVITGSNSAQQVIDAIAGLTHGATILFNPPSSVDCHQLMSQLHADAGSARCVGFTSGTSGSPKAVVHSERNLILPGLISADLEPPASNERIGTSLNLAIMNVMVLGPLSALIRGSTFVVVAQTTPATDGLVEGIKAHSVTLLFTVATQLHDLVNHVGDPAPLNTLERVIVGGSGANAETLEAFSQRFGVRPTLSYGMTEAPTGVVRESFDDAIGSGRGFPLPHVEVSIRNADGEDLPAEDEGEVCLSAATTGPWANTWTGTAGYLCDPERTAELFAGGVLHTGDRGYLDNDGALHVTGRLTSLIIRGGMNVDPVAITQALLAHPAIEDAAVCGFADDRLGQKIGAVVVTANERVIDDEELRSTIRQQLSTHAVPDVILVWPELPRNPLGKVTALDPTIFTSSKR